MQDRFDLITAPGANSQYINGFDGIQEKNLQTKDSHSDEK
jgi:hypothetical protein